MYFVFFDEFNILETGEWDLGKRFKVREANFG